MRNWKRLVIFTRNRAITIAYVILMFANLNRISSNVGSGLASISQSSSNTNSDSDDNTNDKNNTRALTSILTKAGKELLENENEENNDDDEDREDEAEGSSHKSKNLKSSKTTIKPKQKETKSLATILNEAIEESNAQSRSAEEENDEHKGLSAISTGSLKLTSKHSDDDADDEEANSEKTEQDSIISNQEKPDIEETGLKITGSIYKDSSKSSSPSADEEKDHDDPEESENENSDLLTHEISNEQVEIKNPRLDKSATDNYLATNENDSTKDKLKHKKKKRKKTTMSETKKYQDFHHKKKPGSKNAGLSSINKGIKGKSKGN